MPMLKYLLMKNSKSLLVYEDDPVYGIFLKLIMVLVPTGLLILSVYLWLSGEVSGAIALFAESLLVIVIFWAVFPRKYQIFEDQIRIVLGGPFYVKIGFEKIKAVKVTSGTSLSMNFVTNLATTYVLIIRKSGMDIAITPKNNSLYVENANQAIQQWSRRAK